MEMTIHLDDRLLRDMERFARNKNLTLDQAIEKAAREMLRSVPSAPRSAVHLPSFRGKGLRPGVDLDDNAALRDLMDAAP